MSGIAARLGVRLKNLALITSWHITYLIRVVRLHNQKLIERKQKPLCEIFLQQPKHSPSHYLAMAQCTLHAFLCGTYKVHKAEQKPYLVFTVLLHLNLDDKLIKSLKNPLQHQSNVEQVTK